MKPTFKNTSFSDLVKKSDELSDIRKEYAQKTSEERRMAASFHYESTIASALFNDALSRAGGDVEESEPDWPGEVTTLAIDPEFAPAILGVGGYAYSYGRINEAMEHFSNLCLISEDKEPDIDKIIEKAADFLCDRAAHDKAIDLVLLASKNNPSNAIYHDLLSYYYGKIKKFDLAIEQGKMAVGLEPKNHEFFSNLGWSYIEFGDFDEAEKVLNKSLEIDPDYGYAKGNLEELKTRRMEKKNTSIKNLSNGLDGGVME